MGILGFYRTTLVLCLLVLASYPALAEISYSFEVAENGETTATITLTEPAILPLPADALNPQVEGGTYSSLDNAISVKTNNAAIITYTSSYHTRKQEGVWHFESSVPFADHVTLTLPQAVHVVQALPRATITKTDRWQLMWNNLSANATVSFVRVAQASATQQAVQQKTPRGSGLLFLLLAIVAIGLVYYFSKRKQTKKAKTTKQEHKPTKQEHKPTRREHKPAMNEGQLNVIRAANPNEALVLKIVLKHNGHIKRNQLEKESNISKSSLASSLKNLERKNVVLIDRTFSVHHITLSPWFKDLK